jgi:hypothetical protein
MYATPRQFLQQARQGDDLGMMHLRSSQLQSEESEPDAQTNDVPCDWPSSAMFADNINGKLEDERGIQKSETGIQVVGIPHASRIELDPSLTISIFGPLFATTSEFWTGSVS